MNPEYAAYCQADRDFYDAPYRPSAAGGTRDGSAAGDAADGLYATARTPLPEGWESARNGGWFSCHPSGLDLPPQGWKIHVSAALDNAESVLRRVADHCFAHRLSFKFVPSPGLLKLRNGKYADRGASGKFITVYPPSEDAFPAICTDLMELLEGEHGPYILSDLRCGDGPVHVRYGGFSARFCVGPDGRPVPAVSDPSGTLVPDPRGPVLSIPEWVTPPAFLAPHIEARNAAGTGELPYEIQGALHFSNGGGVYRARHTGTGESAVLKEGRPYAGLAGDGADAIARLERERAALEQLAGLDCVPRVLGFHAVGDHRFLALEHIPGLQLNTVFARRFPLSSAAPGPERLAEHTAWAHRMYAMVERAVAKVHERGLVFGDLHLGNIVVSEDGSRIVLIDFEAATPVDGNHQQIVANPGFVAPADRRGADIDRYALACLRLALFFPLTALFTIDRGRVERIARDIVRIFPVTEDELAPAVREILRHTPQPGDPAVTEPRPSATAVTEPGLPVTAVTEPRPSATAVTEPGLPVTAVTEPRPSANAVPAARVPANAVPEPHEWPDSRDSMARAILASFTPERDDRCFPGDIAQFAGPAGGQSFGYGAAGVLYALRETGAPPCPEAVEWLLARSKQPGSGSSPGFYDGLAGIAWTLHRLGHPAQAAELARIVTEQQLEALAPDLHGGQAGIALALDDLARDATGAEAARLRDAADRCTAAAARSLTEGRPSSHTGLLHGATGLALLFVRRYETTGDPALLDLAALALRRDLDRCKPAADGALHVLDGKRTMPYLGSGSAGIALVLDDYLAHRDDDGFAAARAAIEPALRSSFYIQPGLFRGIAGLVLQLARTPLGDRSERERAIRRHCDLLGTEATPYAGGLAFPGEQLMRRSMDLVTGTAGVLLALGGAHHSTPVSLPFLPPLKRPTNRPHPGAAHQ
ncbi:class III lanthionine synthetase LanKC [Streptomyces yaizuensis]|uniref:Class III lanthionine synthetase LanKC n=1 Tax=Streptomyces yaizuensis TaxID=2989713 RepID=A0ABQ5P6N8_9ACTN|nr:class III lanthionine synthetase LanKC [Streptomyces sp. YSPA8]GLF97911.1 class III lanthionine synthetase LanKC [Streptomyces sp. YSPA8]